MKQFWFALSMGLVLVWIVPACGQEPCAGTSCQEGSSQGPDTNTKSDAGSQADTSAPKEPNPSTPDRNASPEEGASDSPSDRGSLSEPSPDRGASSEQVSPDTNTPEKVRPEPSCRPQNEVCNGKDDNCDGQIDEGCPNPPPPTGSNQDVVGYLKSTSRLNAVYALSDGTFLLAGGAPDLKWVPAGVTTSELQLGDASINSKATGRYAFLVHVSKDLTSILEVVHFPKDTVHDVFRIRGTEVPNTTTGDLYISGSRTTSSYQSDGYYIAKLDNNFVKGTPQKLTWAFDVRAKPRQAGGYQGSSKYKSVQPWDVGPNGQVTFGEGSEYDFSWASIQRLDANGQPTVVEHWTLHSTDGGECAHQPASTCPSQAKASSIVMKLGRSGSMRSHSQADYDATMSDGNGRTDRKGKWPEDIYFSGPCLKDSAGKWKCAGQGGYTGYRVGSKPTGFVGGIVIDRRNGDMYFGYNNMSKLPGGNPDFEPALVAMDKEGKLKWWSRLYHERVEQKNKDGSIKKDSSGKILYHTTSSPDQYVDGVAIDYKNNMLVVLARCHGNNVINFWSGNKVSANPNARGFQNQFTGTNGNIHISWLGKLSLPKGTLQHATYVAEFSADNVGHGKPMSSGLLKGWPSPNAGWPKLNTTRCQNELKVDHEGNVLVVCRGRRTFTTSNAYQQQYKPSEGLSGWSDFIRVYKADLSDLLYSSILRHTWDKSVDGGSNSITMTNLVPLQKGALVVGYHKLDSNNKPLGKAIPTKNTPAWCSKQPTQETGVIAQFKY